MSANGRENAEKGDSKPNIKMTATLASTGLNNGAIEKTLGLNFLSNGVEPATQVNAWTEWGTLREIVVGNADNANFPPMHAAMHPSINVEGGSSSMGEDGKITESEGAGAAIERELGWPVGPKNQAIIDAANWQLDNLAKVLSERGVKVRRPNDYEQIDWSQPIKTPFFSVPNQYCATCPRDIVATVGNIVIEASMSRRDRYFEVQQYRQMIRDVWRGDPEMLWKAAPKPSMADSMYDDGWWGISKEERYARMHSYRFCITDEEPIFDAADMMRCGKDLFVQLSMTSNGAGHEWLARELAPHGLRVHTVRFPYDLAPSHLDCTFVPLRPGLVLTNPERPIDPADKGIFEEAGWRFIDAPQPDNPIRPWASQSSKWLSMNVLSVSPTCVVAEEQEHSLHALLESEGFEVIKVPFRAVYEFGGGLHCATWELNRDDDMSDYFPEAELASTLHPASRKRPAAWQKLRGGLEAATAAPAAASGTKQGYDALESREDRRDWTGIKEQFDGERLDIDGHPVMQAWEAPYMASLAQVAARNGGRVLEVGFGLGLSAGAIQAHPEVTEHLIMEANADVYTRLEDFATTSARRVTPVGPGLWQDTIGQVPDGSLDGILYDTYPLSKEEQHTHQFEFIAAARDKLKKGGVLTYCNLTSLGVLKGEYADWAALFEATQVPHLLAAGWKREEMAFEVAPAAPPPECEYYCHDTALVPILTKSED